MRTTTNNDFIVLPNPSEGNKIPQYKQVIPVSLYHFYIIDEIGEPDSFLDLINTLKTAEEHDTVFIYLNTPGGSLQTTVQVISAMRQSRATIVTCLEGEVCSAGTLIFLSGHRHIVNPNCTFMIHNYSQWLGGKGNEVALRVKYSEHYFKKLAIDLYNGFLSDEEIEAVIEGKDYWMESEEVIERLNQRNNNQISEDVAQVADEALATVSEMATNQELPQKSPQVKKSRPLTKKTKS